MTESTGMTRREAELLLYATPDGAVKVRVLFRDETAWLTQKTLAALFGVGVPAINKHLNNIFESGELSRSATVSRMEIAQSEGDRRLHGKSRSTDAIIAVGYRVNSYQATQFRISDFDRVVQETRRLERKQEPKALGPGKGRKKKP